MPADKPDWVEMPDVPGDAHYDGYPELSLEDWHKKHGLWAD